MRASAPCRSAVNAASRSATCSAGSARLSHVNGLGTDSSQRVPPAT
jgi:hypothetical protein